MRIEHVAVWTNQLETMKDFYVKYFGGVAGEKYVSKEHKGGRFESYFLTMGTGARLEIMQESTVTQKAPYPMIGFSHIAFKMDTPEAVMALAQGFKNDGLKMAGEPRRTGDGYFEASVLDPDGNIVEITTLPEE